MRRIERIVRGPYDKRLREVLLAATLRPHGCKQTSLAEMLRRDQSGLSKWLHNKAGGPMDLDTAHVALRHCGLGGLREFVTEAPVPPDDVIPFQVLSFLRGDDEFRQLLRDLLDVPPGGRAELLTVFQSLVRARMRESPAGRPPGTTPGSDTTEE
jgi:hypothetical protein